jgi:hypothetical protein
MFQFIKTYIKNVADIFPGIVLNKNEYSDITMRHWDLSQIHYGNINKIIREYYQDLTPFYNNKSLEIVLNAIHERCKSLVDLSILTPYFPEKNQKAFDKRMSHLLLEYYFLRVVNEYIELSNNNPLFFEYSVREDISMDDIFSTEYQRDERN